MSVADAFGSLFSLFGAFSRFIIRNHILGVPILTWMMMSLVTVTLFNLIYSKMG